MPYPCCMNLGYLPLRVVVRQSLFLIQMNSGLGYVFCFGQWKVSGHGSKRLNVHAWIGMCPGYPGQERKKKTCSRLELKFRLTQILQLTHGPMRFMMQSSDTLRLLHKTDSKSLSKFWGPYGTNRI